MEHASLHEVKKELQILSAAELVELCLSLAKYKKDNKEYLAYLLFRSQGKEGFVNEVKEEVDLHFSELRAQSNLYFVKKSLRKLLRLISKYTKYVGDKAVSAELLIYFCKKVREANIPFRKSQLLVNMYEQQLKKITTLVNALHEDLRQDYMKELESIAL